MTEQEIIKGCSTKDRLATKALVDKYSAYLYAICYRYMGESEKAKDALQESLIQIITKIDKYSDQGKFKSWISAVTVKKCLDQLRKEKRHTYTNYENSPEPYVDEDCSLRLEKADVMKFIEGIPDRYRTAINMYLIEGYSHKEIADLMEITESSSRSLVSRGRKMIIDAFALNSVANSRISEELTPAHSLQEIPKLRIV